MINICNVGKKKNHKRTTILLFAIIHILNVNEASKYTWKAPPIGNNYNSNSFSHANLT